MVSARSSTSPGSTSTSPSKSPTGRSPRLRWPAAASPRLQRRAGGELARGAYNDGVGSSIPGRALAELVGNRFEARPGARPGLRPAPAEPDPPASYRVAVDRLAAAGWRATRPVVDAVDELVVFC